MHALRENFRQTGESKLQGCLDELHDGIMDGVALLLGRVIGLCDNYDVAMQITFLDLVLSWAGLVWVGGRRVVGGWVGGSPRLIYSAQYYVLMS